jgi:hypothetical protein
MSAVSPRARRSLALLALLCLLFLSGCGGGEGDSTSSEATSAQGQAATTSEGNATAQDQGGTEQGGGEDQSAKAKIPSQTPSEPNPPIAGERIPGSKAVAPGVPVTKGGDNSIQAYGTEGEEGEAEQATASLKSYLDARASGDWAGACEAASAQLREELGKLIEQAKAKGDTEKPKGCAEILELLFGKTPQQALQEAARIDRVLSFRTQADGYAYLILEAEGKVKFIAMASEDGTWKPNTLEPEAFKGPQGENQ